MMKEETARWPLFKALWFYLKLHAGTTTWFLHLGFCREVLVGWTSEVLVGVF